MNRRIYVLPTLSIMLLMALATCTEKTTLVQNVQQGDQVMLSGDLHAWRCGIGDVINNQNMNPFFGVQTKDTARIIIAYANGWRDTVYTDTLSHFGRLVSTGLHQIYVETRYTITDTFQVNLERDTNLSLDILYDVYDPSRIEADFWYYHLDDTLTADSEWAIIRDLNVKLNWKLEMNWDRPADQPRYKWSLDSDVSVSYPLRMTDRQSNVIYVASKGMQIYASDSANFHAPYLFVLGCWPVACMDAGALTQ